VQRGLDKRRSEQLAGERPVPAPGSFRETTDYGRFEVEKAANKRAENLSPKRSSDLQAGRVFLSDDGGAGFMLDRDGDLQNVFNNSPVEGLLGIEGDDIAHRVGARVAEIRSLVNGQESPLAQLKRLAPDSPEAAAIHEALIAQGRQAMQEGGFYLPSKTNAPTRGARVPAQRGEGQFGLAPPRPNMPELTHRYTAALQRTGKFRTDATGLAADAYKGAQRYATLQRGFDQILRLAKDTMEEAGGPQFAIPVRRTAAIPTHLREYIQKADRGALTKADAQAIKASGTPEELRAYYFPEAGAAPDSEIAYVDRRLVADLAKKLPDKTGVDTINNALRFSVLYTRPAYAINLLQNIGTHTLQAGVFAPANLRKALHLGRDLGESDRQLIFALTGNSKSRAVEPDRITSGFTHEVGEFWNAATDRVPRAAGWLHEARGAGFKSADEIQMLLHDPRLQHTLVEVTRRANREMIDYGVMTPFERKTLKKWVFFYPWLRASAVWSIRFPLEHPIQAAVYGALGEQGADQLDKNVGEVPAWLEGRMPIQGGETPWMVNPQMLSNFSTLKDVSDLATGEASPREMLSPFYSLGHAGLTGETTLGVPARGPISDALGGGKVGAMGEVASSYVPVYSAFKKGTKEGGGVTIGGRGPAIAQLLGGSFAGGPVDIAKGRDMQKREKKARMRPQEKIAAKIEEGRSVGLDAPPEVVEAMTRRAALDELVERDMKATEKLKIAAQVLHEETGNDRFVGFKPRHEKEAQDVYNDVREILLHELYEWERKLDRELDSRLESAPSR